MFRHQSTSGLAAIVVLLIQAPLSAATPAELEAARSRLIGTWDATPALDLDVLQADPAKDLRYARANVIGTRMIYAFARDGSVQITLIAREGPEDGKTTDRLTPKVSRGTWSVVDTTPDKVMLRLTETGGQPVEKMLTFDGDHSFTLDVHDLAHRVFRSPFVFRRNVGDRAIRWVSQNNRVGPASQLVQDLTPAVAKFVNNQQDFSIRFGKKLMKSDKATEIVAFCEQFYVFELSDQQAAKLNLPESGVAMQGSARPETFPVLTEVKIVDARFDQSGTINLKEPITGKLTFRPVHTVGEGEYSMRIRIKAGEKVVAIFNQFLHPVLTETTLDFEAQPPPTYADYAGPVIISIDVCRMTRFEGGTAKAEVLSTSTSRLFDAVPSAPARGGR